MKLRVKLTIIVKKASYSRVTSEVLLVSIEWDFIDSQGAVFADFCATYHLIQIKDELKIISVVSHDLSSAIVLAHKFSLMA